MIHLQPSAPMGTAAVADATGSAYALLNSTRSEYPRDLSIPDLFTAQAHRTPHATAVEADGVRLSYGELDRRSDALAHRLRAAGVVHGALVAMLMERSMAAIIAMIAILKAGAAYLPLQTDDPPEHARALLADAGASLILVRDDGAQGLAADGIPVLVVSAAEAVEVPPWQPVRIAATDLAYVMYTSGSTGKPKGVEIPHRGVVRLVLGTAYADFTGQTFLQCAPLAFDASTFEIWGALLNGGRLVILTGPPLPASICRAVEEHGVTTLWLTAGLFQIVADGPLESLRGLRQLIAGGDVLSVRHVYRAAAALPDCRLINGYGPTENTTFTCCHTIGPDPVDAIPLGRPIANTTVYILDGDGRLVPPGGIGEIHTGGDGLARGYRRDPALTALKFIPNPLTNVPDDRLYRTGDLGRLNDDGVVEFHGRIDHQLKIRGHRIELGHIETALLGHPEVRAAVVTAAGDDAVHRHLVAYVVPAGAHVVQPRELREFLSERLPAFMMPSVFIAVAEFPLTANGKIDRRRLPQAEPMRSTDAGGETAPGLERELLAVWRAVLQMPTITRDDTLGELGVYSLQAVRLVDAIERACGRAPRLAELVESTSVRTLAEAMSLDQAPVRADAVLRLHEQGTDDPFFFMHGDLLGNGPYAHTIAAALGQHVPFYSLPPCRIDRTSEVPSVRAIAQEHLVTLRAIRPVGPYRLGGYCNGGVVAAEMARILIDQGERVTMLALIDAKAYYPTLRLCRRLAEAMTSARAEAGAARLALFRRLCDSYTQVRGVMAPGGRLRKLFRLVATTLRGGRTALPAATTSVDDGSGVKRSILTAYMWTIGRFQAPPLPVRTVVMYSQEFAPRSAAMIARWRAVAGDVECVALPGNHVEAVAVHGARIGEELRRRW